MRTRLPRSRLGALPAALQHNIMVWRPHMHWCCEPIQCIMAVSLPCMGIQLQQTMICQAAMLPLQRQRSLLETHACRTLLPSCGVCCAGWKTTRHRLLQYDVVLWYSHADHHRQKTRKSVISLGASRRVMVHGWHHSAPSASDTARCLCQAFISFSASAHTQPPAHPLCDPGTGTTT